jgi:hypothetical protein
LATGVHNEAEETKAKEERKKKKRLIKKKKRLIKCITDFTVYIFIVSEIITASKFSAKPCLSLKGAFRENQ